MMCALIITFLALVGCGVVAQNISAPNPHSVYNTIRSQSESCPYLKTTLLKIEPEFLKPCTNFSTFATIGAVTRDNIEQVLCAIFYNDVLLLCLSGNLTGEEAAYYLSEQQLQTASKAYSLAKVCETLGNDTNAIQTVIKPMTVILQRLKERSTCERICSTFEGQLLPACTISAYMLNIITVHKSSQAHDGHASKSIANPVVPSRDNTTSHDPVSRMLVGGVQLVQNKTEQHADNTSTVRKLMVGQPNKSEHAPPASSERKLLSPKPNETHHIGVADTDEPRKLLGGDSGTSTTIKVGEDGNRVKIDGEKAQPKPAQPKPDATKPDVITKKTDVVAAPEESHQLAPPTVDAKATGNDEAKPDQAKESETKIDDGTKVDDKSVIEGDGGGGGDNSQYGQDKQEEDYQGGEFPDDHIQPDVAEKAKDVKETEASVKRPEGKHKTPKPEEIIDDEPALSASYNQHLDEDDSYFFSYFMMVCGVFILAYVGYHNKQKVFALFLEGRRGRRTSRSRRPNSANYHKLDSNLEEAVTSSCNKNTTNIIY